MSTPAEITIPVDEETARRMAADSLMGHTYLIQVGTLPAEGRWFVLVLSHRDGRVFATLRQEDEGGPEIVRSAFPCLNVRHTISGLNSRGECDQCEMEARQ